MSKIKLYESMRFGPALWLSGKRRQKWAEGIIRAYRIPDNWSEADYRYWWCPETDGHGKILRPARMDAAAKKRYLDYEAGNQIMNAGRTQVLSYIGGSSGNATGWSQYFAVGTGAITSTNPNDPALANEVFRKQCASFAVTGTTVDINIQFGTTDGEYTYTNAGLWGNGATGTLGSGTLYTHALFAYAKGAYGISIDYTIDLL